MKLTKSHRAILAELKKADGIRYTGIMSRPLKRLRELGLVELSYDLLPAGRRGRYREIWEAKLTKKGRAADV